MNKRVIASASSIPREIWIITLSLTHNRKLSHGVYLSATLKKTALSPLPYNGVLGILEAMSLSNRLPHLKVRYESTAVVFLRLSLALVFIWFGLLKALGVSPVADVVGAVSPLMATATGLTLLGWFEIALGVGLFLNRFRILTYSLLLAHLAGTFLVFVTAPDMMFSPAFPILTVTGEFVLKNIVLVAAALVALLHESHR